MRYEKEILDYVRNHPGCSRSDVSEAIGDPKAYDEVDLMVEDGHLERWYSGLRPHYYIVGTYTPYPPPHLREPDVETMTSKVQLQCENRELIKVTRNAKGEYSWGIEQHNSPDQPIERIVADFKEIDRQLREAFL